MQQINETLEVYENARKKYLQSHPKPKQAVEATNQSASRQQNIGLTKQASV